MIAGPTGVGKSVFLELYKFLYKKECIKNKKTCKIVWANCSHFGVSSNLARSELFGYEKGAFTDAKSSKMGLVEQADKGVLILEEIGELPFEVQAMLLTLIESGEYRRVGSNETKHAKVRVVGATNREDELREDFQYRFLPFYVPPLHARRIDILYYFLALFPEQLVNFTKSEIMALISYNWPGNVREIERVGFLLRKNMVKAHELPKKQQEKANLRRLRWSDKRLTSLRGGLTDGLLDAIKHHGGDSEFFESMMQDHGLGFSENDTEKPLGLADIHFLEASEDKCYLKQSKRYSEAGFFLFPVLPEFISIMQGFNAFCGLVLQDPDADVNILDNFKNADITNLDLPYGHQPKELHPKLEQLSKSIMKTIRDTNVADDEMPKDLVQYWYALKALAGHNKRQGAVSDDCLSKDSDPFRQNEENLLREYYGVLLQRAGGVVKTAAKMAGHRETTFRSRLDMLGVKYKRKENTAEINLK
jgi:DNA-binding NtrC family response regulator